jgi:hypothetical protein
MDSIDSLDCRVGVGSSLARRCAEGTIANMSWFLGMISVSQQCPHKSLHSIHTLVYAAYAGSLNHQIYRPRLLDVGAFSSPSDVVSCIWSQLLAWSR